MLIDHSIDKKVITVNNNKNKLIFNGKKLNTEYLKGFIKYRHINGHKYTLEIITEMQNEKKIKTISIKKEGCLRNMLKQIYNKNGNIIDFIKSGKYFIFLVKEKDSFKILDRKFKTLENDISFASVLNDDIVFIKNNKLYVFGNKNPITDLIPSKQLFLLDESYIINNKLFSYDHTCLRKINIDTSIEMVQESNEAIYVATNKNMFYLNKSFDSSYKLFEYGGNLKYFCIEKDKIYLNTTEMFYIFNLSTNKLEDELYTGVKKYNIEPFKLNIENDAINLKNDTTEIIKATFPVSGAIFTIVGTFLYVFNDYNLVVSSKIATPLYTDYFIDENYIIFIHFNKIKVYLLTEKGLLLITSFKSKKNNFTNAYIEDNQVYLELSNNETIKQNFC